MQNENKAQHWMQKLEDTEMLSADLKLDKSAAWEKLQQRLQQKPKRRKAIWYWVAAACLLPLILFLSSTLLKQNDTVITSIAYKPAKTKKEIKEVRPAQKDMIVLTASSSSTKKKAVVKKKTNDDVSVVVNKEKKNNVISDSIISNKEEIVVAAIDSTHKKIMAIQIKKKLKVVHINELGEPAESSPYLAHNFSFHSFPLQIAREENYSRPLQLTYKESFISFKAKSPSN